jgi:hypothetical protein
MISKFDRSRYIPQGARRVSHNHSSAVAYVYEIAGNLYAVAFSGKAQKPAWHYRFKSNEERAARVTSFFESVARHETAKREQRRKVKEAGRGLIVGDILRASWGYEQTNIDFYQVTALIGSSMVEMRPIAAESEETGFMSGQCVPVPDKFTGEATRHKASEGTVKMASYCWARRMEPAAMIGDKPVFGASYWSSYA